MTKQNPSLRAVEAFAARQGARLTALNLALARHDGARESVRATLIEAEFKYNGDLVPLRTEPSDASSREAQRKSLESKRAVASGFK